MRLSMYRMLDDIDIWIDMYPEHADYLGQIQNMLEFIVCVKDRIEPATYKRILELVYHYNCLVDTLMNTITDE